MVSTFAIKKTTKGYELIQTSKNAFTNYKPRKYNLGSFKTLREAKKTQRIARALVKSPRGRK